MLTICTPLKNRSAVETDRGTLTLFPNCVRTACDALKELEVSFEWVIADHHSDDDPPEMWMQGYCDDFTVLQLEGHFNRGRALNEAVKASKYSNLCFLDADMLTSVEFFQHGLQNLTLNRATFPICWCFKDFEHSTGFWHNSAFGNCFVTKKMFEIVGGVIPKTNWGLEDTNFFQKIRPLYSISRKNEPTLFHQWHPDSYEWKNRYFENRT